MDAWYSGGVMIIVVLLFFCVAGAMSFPTYLFLVLVIAGFIRWKWLRWKFGKDPETPFDPFNEDDPRW